MKKRKITSDVQVNKLWIARNPDYNEFKDGDYEEIEGELSLFYDSPELKYDTEKRRHVFTNARMLCQIPSYMYPNITAENSPAVFSLEKTNHHEEKNDGKYAVVVWPESQLLFEKEGFEENSYLINDEQGLEDFGSSAYFVDVEWLEKTMGSKSAS